MGQYDNTILRQLLNIFVIDTLQNLFIEVNLVVYNFIYAQNKNMYSSIL